MPDKHDDDVSNAPAQQPFRPRSPALRILRLHPRMEQIRRSHTLQQIYDTGAVLLGTMAALHPLHTIQSRPGDEAAEILKQKNGG